ncbi:sigma-54-dependent transcriptional regulator [Fictibacillus enclensis]|uniref:sigma-54-dependent transcriptional regulator n=1 Tax=Fictibacillus enclensis TaxID=1017270 RepID=UPI0024BF4CAB|nr:sigma-54 dependent transcriptional regulator [Fictibacillus enclensis]WHY73845.1 sigma-54 dependent transcriptional regulator [Fictibacillus enclensis]
MINILIIDDEPEVGHFLSYLLSSKGYTVSLGGSGKDFYHLIRERVYDLALLDIRLPDANGLDILKQLKKTSPGCKSIVMTGYSTIKTAVDAIKLGANDYIEKPFEDIDELESLIDRLLHHNQTVNDSEIHRIAKQTGLVIGSGKEMRHLIMLAYKIAKKNINVLIEGETGTGKEVLAHFVHQASLRSDNPFLAVNCGSLSESLLESELFGHEKGAFTGAIKERKGIFEIANKGTIFLDEIAEASLSTQVKLLRVLESGEYMRVGDEAVRRTNTRIVAASHVDLAGAVEQKMFREDLLYRLEVVKLTIPPLRDRKQDIPELLTYFLEKQQSQLSFSEEAVNLLQHYQWPGNIRELVNVVKRATALAEGETRMITSEYLPDKLRAATYDRTSSRASIIPALRKSEKDLQFYLEDWVKHIHQLWADEQDVGLDEIIQQVKELEVRIGRAFVTKMLKETMGNRKEAAERLEITTRQLRYFLNEKKGG